MLSKGIHEIFELRKNDENTMRLKLEVRIGLFIVVQITLVSTNYINIDLGSSTKEGNSEIRLMENIENVVKVVDSIISTQLTDLTRGAVNLRIKRLYYESQINHCVFVKKQILYEDLEIPYSNSEAEQGQIDLRTDCLLKAKLIEGYKV